MIEARTKEVTGQQEEQSEEPEADGKGKKEENMIQKTG